jgi:adenosylhomocysteine nucleosidase
LLGFIPHNFDHELVETGPGKLNAAMWLARLLAKAPADLVIGAGTAGSLELSLKPGDFLASAEVLISDWRMEDGATNQVAPYGSFNYGPIAENVEKIVIRSPGSLSQKLLASLGPEFLKGRILSSDAFVSGREHKLNLGNLFGCRICEMEAGAIAHVARRSGNPPWLHLRIVADTLDEALQDYFKMELDMTRILGERVLRVLTLLDERWEEYNS